MRRLSPPAAKAVESLVSDPVHALGELGLLAEAAALPWIVPRLLSPDSAVAQAARRAATRILRATPPRDFGWIEQTVRGRLRGNPSGATAWWQLSAAQLPELWGLCHRSDGDGLLQIASFHPSGYVRAEAVRLLAEQELEVALPCLLVRLNDWVAPVQHLAAEKVSTLLRPEAVPDLLCCLALVEQLPVYRRRDLSLLHAQMRALLLAPASRSLIWAACEAERDAHQRRALYGLLADALLTEPGGSAREAGLHRLIQLAMQSADLWLRVWAVRLGRAHLFGEPLRRLLGQARADRGRPVRREALLAFLDSHPELEAALCDPCVSLRELVRYALRKKANLDFPEYYRQILLTGTESRRLSALAGLGETGTRTDSSTLLPYISAPVPRVRAAALRALGQLDPEGSLEVLASALADPASQVVRAAAEAVGRRAALLGAARLMALFDSHADPACRRRLVDLLAQLPCWEQPRVLLQAARDPSPAVAARAELRLRRWLSVSRYVRPSREEASALRNELVQSSQLPALREAVQRRLDQSLV